ncbi:hypothetical protein ACLOJK_005124 [Asimina triloba]
MGLLTIHLQFHLQLERQITVPPGGGGSTNFRPFLVCQLQAGSDIMHPVAIRTPNTTQPELIFLGEGWGPHHVDGATDHLSAACMAVVAQKASVCKVQTPPSLPSSRANITKPTKRPGLLFARQAHPLCRKPP